MLIEGAVVQLLFYKYTQKSQKHSCVRTTGSTELRQNKDMLKGNNKDMLSVRKLPTSGVGNRMLNLTLIFVLRDSTPTIV